MRRPDGGVANEDIHRAKAQDGFVGDFVGVRFLSCHQRLSPLRQLSCHGGGLFTGILVAGPVDDQVDPVCGQPNQARPMFRPDPVINAVRLVWPLVILLFI